MLPFLLAQANFCSMTLSSGRILNLNYLCGNSSPSARVFLCPSGSSSPEITCQLAESILGYDRLSDASQGAKSVTSKELVSAPYQCKEFVKFRLKAPATAIFEKSSSVSEASLKGIYLVRGQVSDQNVYGAMRNKPYSCLFKGGGNGLEYLDVGIS